MKLRLSTIFWMLTAACLIILLLVKSAAYETLRKEHSVRENRIKGEFLRVAGKPISPDELEQIFSAVDLDSVRIAAHFAEQQLARQKVGFLSSPSVVLQLRSGAVGGNPVTLNMIGEARRLRKISQQEIDVKPVLDSSESQTGYFRGGYIPNDKVFIIERVEYKGFALGDSNGGGDFSVNIGGTEIVQTKNTGLLEMEKNVWQGEIVVRPGDESNVVLEISNSSSGEALISGRFEPLEDHQDKL